MHLFPQKVLNYAIKNGNFEVIKYLLTEWEHRDVIIKDRCICHPLESQGITLPPLLLTILCQKLKDIKMTNDILELLTAHFKPAEIGMNWVCNIPLREQKRYYQFRYYDIPLSELETAAECEGLLFVNISLDTIFIDYADRYWTSKYFFFVGSMMAALALRCRQMWPWRGDRRYRWGLYNRSRSLEGMERMIEILVKNGLDCNIDEYCHRLKEGRTDTKGQVCQNDCSPLSKGGKLVGLIEFLEEDPAFGHFFRKTVRKAWLTHVMPAFLESSVQYEGLGNIFKYVLLEYLCSF